MEVVNATESVLFRKNFKVNKDISRQNLLNQPYNFMPIKLFYSVVGLYISAVWKCRPLLVCILVPFGSVDLCWCVY
jgi:FtsH-binding integral membrane protein